MLQVKIDPDVVGDISKIRIEHDGRLPGKGWRLDKARILRSAISSVLIFYYTNTATEAQSNTFIKAIIILPFYPLFCQ